MGLPNGHPGFVYLIHFDRPYQHARHYLGWTIYLDERMRHHERGSGARLMAAVSEAGIPWWIVRLWEADRCIEARFKRMRCNTLLCPVCNPGNSRGDIAPASYVPNWTIAT